MFTVAGKNYTILTRTDNGIGIDKQHPYDTQMQYFSTADSLLNCFKIDGITLGELSEQFIITDYR